MAGGRIVRAGRRTRLRLNGIERLRWRLGKTRKLPAKLVDAADLNFAPAPGSTPPEIRSAAARRSRH